MSANDFWLNDIKLEFHGTDMDTDTDTDSDVLSNFCARMLVRKSACPAGHARGSSPTCLLTFV